MLLSFDRAPFGARGWLVLSILLHPVCLFSDGILVRQVENLFSTILRVILFFGGG